MDQLPHPAETGAEVIVEQIAQSVPLWDSDLAYTGSGDLKDPDEKGGDEKDALNFAGGRSGGGTAVGVEAWLQGEIIPRGNIMPDFVVPNVRLTVRCACDPSN